MKREPKSVQVAAMIGLAIGLVLWWLAYQPGKGLFQNVQLIVLPGSFGILAVSLWNRRHRVGPYDPDNQKPRA